jgi:hypothetical protein
MEPSAALWHLRLRIERMPPLLLLPVQMPVQRFQDRRSFSGMPRFRNDARLAKCSVMQIVPLL